MSLLDQDMEETNVHQLRETPEPAPSLVKQWARFKDQIAESSTESPYSVEQIEEMIYSQQAFLIPGEGSAIIAEMQEHGGKRYLLARWAVGSVEELKRLMPGLDAIARMMDCDGVMIEGHAGWKRILADQGYKFFSMTLIKDV